MGMNTFRFSLAEQDLPQAMHFAALLRPVDSPGGVEAKMLVAEIIDHPPDAFQAHPIHGVSLINSCGQSALVPLYLVVCSEE